MRHCCLLVVSSIESAGGVLNLKNPACYVFGEANSCAPGDQFLAADTAAAEAFTSYKPFPFRVSSTQSIADIVNLLAAGAVAIFLLAFAVRRAVAAMPRKPGAA